MKRSISFAVILCVFTMVGAAYAGTDIPDVKGTWTKTVQGAVHHKQPNPKAHTNVKTGHADIKLTLKIDKQDGFRFSGVKESARMKESISGVIGFDNKSIYMVDDDGIMLCKLVAPDKMEYIYLRVTSDFSVAARAILDRKR